MGIEIKALDERPDVETGYEWIWQAFNRLSTTRPQGFGQGNISYMTTMQYGRDMEMGPGEREFLWDVIKKLDSVFLARIAKKKPPPTPPRR